MTMTPGPMDLALFRVFDAPRALVWRAWTEPELLKQWWAPKPVEIIECVMDLRPGGLFRTVMRAPDGTEMPGDGAFLEVVEGERIVFTDALQRDYRPNEESFMTAILTFSDAPGGKTRYEALVLHKNEADCKKHADMGFHDGWGTAADQLGELALSLKESA